MDDLRLSAADHQELEAARERYVEALRTYLDVTRRLSPYQVGQHIPEDDFEYHSPMMVIEAVCADLNGVLTFTGTRLTKGGKPGKRFAIRRINLHHLDRG
jgi:hypothetical protein